MNAAWFAVERFAEIATVALNIYFMYMIMDAKVALKNQIVAACVFVFAQMLYFWHGFGFRPYFAVLCSIAYACYVFAGDVRQYAVWSVLAVVIDGVVDIAVLSVYLLFSNASVELASGQGADRAAVVLSAKALLFLAYRFVARGVDKSNRIKGRDCALMLLVPIGCWMLLEALMKFGVALPRADAQPMLAVSGFALLMIIVSVVILYNRISLDGKELVRAKLQLRVYELTQEHVSQVKSLHAQLSSVRHDLHNHFSAIHGLIAAKKYGALDEYVAKLVDIGADILDYCDHPAINALVSSRASAANAEGIKFEASLMFPESLPIGDVDLCILVGNILDNAFEAGKAACEPRFINLSARVVNSYWAVACRNSVREKGAYRSFGSIVSTKDNSGMHGIGTRQISAIAEKTGGFVTYRRKEHVFSTLAMLKMPE
jgi:hypothetical protein